MDSKVGSIQPEGIELLDAYLTEPMKRTEKNKAATDLSASGIANGS